MYQQLLEIVDVVTDPMTQIPLEDAKNTQSAVSLAASAKLR